MKSVRRLRLAPRGGATHRIEIIFHENGEATFISHSDHPENLACAVAKLAAFVVENPTSAGMIAGAR